jgi:hypothetical protein
MKILLSTLLLLPGMPLIAALACEKSEVSLQLPSAQAQSALRADSGASRKKNPSAPSAAPHPAPPKREAPARLAYLFM